MSTSLAEKIWREPGVSEYAERIKKLFGKADKNALREAIQKKDFARTCQVLGISEKEYKTLLESGLDITRFLLKKYPELAEKAKTKRG